MWKLWGVRERASPQDSFPTHATRPSLPTALGSRTSSCRVPPNPFPEKQGTVTLLRECGGVKLVACEGHEIVFGKV